MSNSVCGFYLLLNCLKKPSAKGFSLVWILLCPLTRWEYLDSSSISASDSSSDAALDSVSDSASDLASDSASDSALDPTSPSASDCLISGISWLSWPLTRSYSCEIWALCWIFSLASNWVGHKVWAEFLLLAEFTIWAKFSLLAEFSLWAKFTLLAEISSWIPASG